MESDAYSEWIKLYDNDFEHIWFSQHIGLRKAAMLLKAIDNEFKTIQRHVETEFVLYEEKIQNIEKLNATIVNSSLENEKENTHNDLIMPSLDLAVGNNFTKISTLNDSTNVITYSTSGDESNKSPKINRHRKMKFKKSRPHNVPSYSTLKLLQQSAANLNSVIRDDVIDTTVVETSPIPTISRSVKHNKFAKRSKSKNSFDNTTITQMFSNIASNTTNDERDMSATYCPYEADIITIDTPPKVTNKDENHNSEHEVKRPLIYKEPTVRGKKRFELEGWDCNGCQKFYEARGLSTQETKELLNKCSRHRGKMKPVDYTPKGFWSMTFPPTPKK